MSMFDKAKDKAEQLAGEAKQKIGERTGNEDLKNAGKADEVTGEAKEAGHRLRDKVAGAVRDVKARMSGER